MNKLLPASCKSGFVWFLRALTVLVFLTAYSKTGFSAFQSGFSFKSGAESAWDVINLTDFKNPVLRSIFAQSESLIFQSTRFSEIDYLFSCDSGLFVTVKVSNEGVSFTELESCLTDTSCDLASGFLDSDEILNLISDSGYFDVLPSGARILSYEIILSGYSPFFLPINADPTKPVYQVKAKTGRSGSDPTGDFNLVFESETGQIISSDLTDFYLFSVKSRLTEVYEYADSFYPDCKLLSVSSTDFNNFFSDSLTVGLFIDAYFTFLSKEGKSFSVYLFQNNKPIFCGNEFSAGLPVPNHFFLDSDTIAAIAFKNGGLEFLQKYSGSEISYFYGNLKIPGNLMELTCWAVTYRNSDKNSNLVIWIDGGTGEIIDKGINVSTENLPERPAGFNLGTNFPNPFNGETNFPVSATSDQYIDIDLFDLSGREVSSRKGVFIGTGNSQINLSLSNLSSGLYFCRFLITETGKSRQSILYRKILIQK